MSARIDFAREAQISRALRITAERELKRLRQETTNALADKLMAVISGEVSIEHFMAAEEAKAVPKERWN